MYVNGFFLANFTHFNRKKKNGDPIPNIFFGGSMEIHTPEKLPTSSAFNSVSIKVHPIRPENLHRFDLWSSPFCMWEL